MEMEGRGLSDLFRNTSEEIFLKAVMENSIGVAAPPSMEMMGFRNMTQSFREDSEELFNSWLMNGEIPGFSHLNNRPRQPSRLSSEAGAFPNQQHDIARQNFLADNLIPENCAVPPEYTNNHNQQPLKNAAEKGMQASDLLLAKQTWFHCTQPMTRSRSSELRRRYAAMQSNVSPITTGTMRAANQLRLDFTNTNAANSTPMGSTPLQTSTFVSPSCSSTSPLDNPQMLAQDTVTSVVSMLKDTLERKKLSSPANRDMPHGNPFGFYDNQQFQHNILGGTDMFPLVTNGHVQDSLMLPEVERPTEPNAENFVAPASQIWISAASREPSQSGSSNALTAQSAGFEVCDELRPMGQSLSMCESTRKNVANGTADCRSNSKDYREKVLKDNLKDERKRVALTRMGSISSEQAVDRGDPTKKRRVERTRKMAEAKERSSTPVIPTDMQAVLKRCENLEKEVRSLKLNLSFMNRKDSEQTKQIEDLQKQNEDMAEEKERLIEEIERMASDSTA
ncbi:protein CYCLOPS-like isoform X1 [Triticum urartu]|uniref:protein CYCLOPS-like isoform X1 n=1 Tax=Triticum urartu TaxID=4572 RepID=UPI0020431AE7|nr:protein CYCLOPS-like isoform X1 [Triticum urartu]XP_048544690.1 protein CYCLOPS-like isoform X1 [Triticum urartu]XP_048544691.1 protein CYCLOPS-like isoform X1 [Triticum urartu]